MEVFPVFERERYLYDMRRSKYLLAVMLPVQIIFINVISFFPAAVEKYYSNGIYPGISRFSRYIWRIFPFSAGDAIYAIVIILILSWLWKNRKTWKHQWKQNLVSAAALFSIVYFLLNFLWGMNYHRVKLYEKLRIGHEYSNAELLAFTKRLIVKTNEVQFRIAGNDSLKVIMPYTQEALFVKALHGYELLAVQYPGFRYDVPCIKRSLFSLPLTYMGFAGYLNPFTGEAQVNAMLPMYNFPTTTAHEMAHQIGYASESEANFIGFLASIKNEDPYMQYSGYSFALKYCLRNWAIIDKVELEKLKSTVNPGILKNYDEAEKFWDRYESFIETGFKIFYDHFLKWNDQKEGLESYSRFVDLMVNYYTTRPLE